MTEDRRRERLLKKLNPEKVVRTISYNEPVPKGDFKEMGEYIIAFQRPLAFTGYTLDTTSISKFLAQFMELNKVYNTKYADNNTSCCPAGRRRSLVDIFLMTRYYFPKVGLLTVASAILNNSEIDSNICQMICRRVYFIRNGGPAHLNAVARDEFGYDEKGLKALVDHG